MSVSTFFATMRRQWSVVTIVLVLGLIAFVVLWPQFRKFTATSTLLASTAPAGASALPPPSLSPSRAGDFLTCPLLYRFRAIDRLPEPPSTAQVRGSVVHAALEQLYGLPADQRGPQTVDALMKLDLAAGVDVEIKL